VSLPSKPRLAREVSDFLAGIFEPEADQLRLGLRIVNQIECFNTVLRLMAAALDRA
jgi:hypothetical protein